MEANYYMVVIVAILLSTAIAYLLGNRFAKRAVVELELAKQELEKINELLIAGQNAKALMQADVQQAQLQLARTEADKQGVLAANQLLSKDLADVKQSVELFRSETQKAKEQSAAAQSELAGSAAQLHDLKNRFESAVKELSELRSKNTNLHAELSETKSSLDSLEKQNAQLEQRLHTVLAEKQELQQQHTQLTRDSSEAKAQLESQRMQSHDLIVRLEQSQAEHSTLRTTYQQLTETHTQLKTSLQEKELHFAEQLKLLQDSKLELKKEFEHLANDILEKKGTAFKEMNRESMATILSPIHEELKGFKTKVEHIHQQETEQRVKLRTELENLQKLNMQITDQAEKLTKALKGEKKVQGNWGELMLENVLESSGLRLGSDYQREVSIGTEEGTFRPDAIIYLPQNKHLVIDAKTSLNAYTRFVNAEDEIERKAALKEHAQAVKSRISELANKEYTRLPTINSPEVVIMFIPIESAYVEALREDESIFQKAIEQKVLVATPTTLLTSLNIVRQLWRFEEQNKHTAALAERAERFYKKLNSFLESMQAVGNQLDKAKTTYNKAFSQLYTGPGNLILQASQFKELGVSVQKELPVELVNVAKLELATSVDIEALDVAENS